eukprot:8713214-Pyramimonas_sp.AAC.1
MRNQPSGTESVAPARAHVKMSTSEFCKPCSRSARSSAEAPAQRESITVVARLELKEVILSQRPPEKGALTSRFP